MNLDPLPLIQMYFGKNKLTGQLRGYFNVKIGYEYYFQNSNTHTRCPWKGEASYYNIVIRDKVEEDAAWYYPEPKEAAKEIKNYVAFYKGVR